MSTIAVAAESVSANAVNSSARGWSKADPVKGGVLDWKNLLGEDTDGSVFASRSTMQSAVEKASSEGLITGVQAEHLNDAIDKLPSQERPTYAEAAKLLSDFGLDVTRSVTFTTDSTGNAVVSFVDSALFKSPTGKT
jgi:hypothetical protein